MSNINFNEQKKLENIALEYLYPGLVVQDDIFNHNGKVLLIAKGITLTKNMIGGLKNFNDLQKNIKVSAKVHKELTDRGIPQKYKQNTLEEKAGYTEVKEKTKRMLTITQITKQIPYKQVCDIGDLTMQRLKITDPAILFQCINGGNEVDEYLFKHSINVAIINGLIGKWLNLDEKEIENLVMLGLVHDVGKTRVPPEILNLPRKLTPQEFEVVKKHSVYSYEILNENKNFSETIKKAALSHHEKMNGSGYRGGLSADEIPFYAKITSVSDIYDAMVSNRCYKEAQSPFRVLTAMEDEKFSGLDIRLLNVFNKNMPKELIGKSVLMSNGAAGVVKFINETNIEFPIVEINGEIIVTNDDLYCVCMIIDDDAVGELEEIYNA